MKETAAYLTIATLIIGFILNSLLSFYSRVYADILGTIAFIIFLTLSYLYLWRDAWKLYLISMLVGFIYEFIGVNTGIPFGNYHYIGFKTSILGVPIPIAIAWGTYLIVTYLTASYFTETRWRKYILTSLFMVTIDLAADPVMVSNNLWRWDINIDLSWFGVPITNYLGWIIVSLTALYLYDNVAEDSEKTNALKLSPIAYITLFMTFASLITRRSLTPFTISFSIAIFIIICLYTRKYLPHQED